MQLRLKKQVFGIKGVDKVLDRNFSELSPEVEKFNVDKFFRLYDRLFFRIPKEGNQSHTSIIRKSTSYIGDYVDDKEYQIQNLTNEVARLSEAINEQEQEHPFFPNGKLLSNPLYVHGEENDELFQAYVMENGKKRGIRWWAQHKFLRGSLGYNDRFGGAHEGTGWKGYLHPTQGMLDNIPDGEPIYTDDDLFTELYSIPPPLTDFLQIRATIQNQNLTAAQKFILQELIDLKEPALAGEDDPNVLINLPTEPLVQFIIEYSPLNIDAVTGAQLVERAKQIIEEKGSWYNSIKEKAVVNSNTLYRQAIQEVHYLWSNGGLTLLPNLAVDNPNATTPGTSYAQEQKTNINGTNTTNGTDAREDTTTTTSSGPRY